jgi:hypothetical protein
MQNGEDESLEATPKPIYINLTIDINYFVQRGLPIRDGLQPNV